jgi:hypothetical protein
MAERDGKRFDSPDEVREFIGGKGHVDRPVKRLRRRIA